MEMSFLDTLKHKAKRFRSPSPNPEVGNIAFTAAKESLKVLRETLDGVPVPGLKGAIGGLLAVMNTIDRVKQNVKDFEDLSKYLNSLNDVLSQFTGADGTPEFPVSLQKPMNTLAEGIERISSRIKEISAHKRWRRVVDNFNDAQAFMENLRDIGQLLQNFQMHSTVILADLAEQNAKKLAQLLNKARQDVLNQLPVAEGALYNSSEREFVSGCLADTRVAVRADIRQWIFDLAAPPVFWLNGLAGTGKSTIAQSIAEFCAAQKCLAASFFFSRDKLVRHSTDLFFTTIARQLSTFNLHLSPHLAEALEANPSLPRAKMFDQFSFLVAQPLRLLKRKAPQDVSFPMVVVVDALDECEGDEAVSRLLSLLLSEFVTFTPPLLKFFITSRPEPHIGSTFKRFEGGAASQPFILHEVARDVVQLDIRTYLESEFQDIRDRWGDALGKDLNSWPSPQDVQALVERSAGLFIYASTMLKFVDNEDMNPQAQLTLVLDIKNDENPEVHTGLDRLYQEIISSCPHLDRVREVIGTILFVVNPLSVGELDELLGLRHGDVRLSLRRLQSVLLIPPDDDHSVRLFHPSFHDFLTVERRSGKYHVDPDRHHARITLNCISLIQTFQNGENNNQQPVTPRTKAMNYASDCWASHLFKVPFDDSLLREVAAFIHSSYGLWLQASNGYLESVVSSLESIYHWIRRASNPPSDFINLLSKHLHDLGLSLRARYLHLGNSDDISAAERAHERAIEFFPGAVKPPHYFYELGLALRLHAQGQPGSSNLATDQLVQFRDIQRKAVEVTPEYHGDYPAFSMGLATTLRAAFGLNDTSTATIMPIRSNESVCSSGIIVDTDENISIYISESISILENTSAALPFDHPNKAPCLNSLGISFQARFDTLGDIQDLNRAIEAYALAGQYTLETHPTKVIYLNNLGIALRRRFDYCGDDGDMQKAITVFGDASQGLSGPPSVHFQAAANHARCIKLSGKGSALEAYNHALASITRVLWSGLDHYRRQEAIIDVPRFVHQAVGAAVVDGRLDKAIEWAEQGCSLTWIDLRIPFHMVNASTGDLTARIKEVARCLEMQDSREPLPVLGPRSPQAAPERVAREYEELCSKWAQLLAEAQSKPEIMGFKVPRTFTELRAVANRGFVVVLNATRSLPITYSRLEDLARQVQAVWRPFSFVAQTFEERDRLPSSGIPLQNISRMILQELWVSIVKPILDILDLKLSPNPPRLWWCPTGPFAELPLHAATSFDHDTPIIVSDFVISSYTPTLNALAEFSPQTTQRFMFVSVSGLDGLSEPSIRDSAFMQGITPRIPFTTFEDSQATLKNVETELRVCSGIHLATTAWLGGDMPGGGFYMWGAQRLTLSRLMKGSVPNFAYIPYRRGTFGPFPSQVASDMLAIGFRSIVETQSYVFDSGVATKVATQFYTELIKLGGFMFAAKALHLALMTLRKEGVPIEALSSFVHIGV